MRRIHKIGIVAASVLGLAGGGIAYASIPDSGTGVYHACVKDAADANGNGHMVRMIDAQASEACSSGWTEKTWNQVGPTGPTGPQGPAGSDATVPTGTLYGIHVEQYSFTIAANTEATQNPSCVTGSTPRRVVSVQSFVQVGSNVPGTVNAGSEQASNGGSGVDVSAFNHTAEDGTWVIQITCASITS